MKKQFRITLNGKSYDVVAEILGEEDYAPAVEQPSGRRQARSAGAAAVAAPSSKPAPAGGGEKGEVPSPLAGKVVSVNVSPGQEVKAGDNVITLEAMKMNTVVSAPGSGKVGTIHVKAGDSVEEGQALLTID